MMTERNMQGERLRFRPLVEADMSEAERARAWSAQRRAEQWRAMHGGLIDVARSDRPGFGEMARWIVGACRTGMEVTVEEELDSLGIECWCPKEVIRRPPLRGKKAVKIERAIFRGYVFVRVIPSAEAFAGVLSASRIHSLMGRDGQPYLMPPRLMDMLVVKARKMQQEQDDETGIPFAAGQVVRIRSGPFAHFAATVRAILGDTGRAQVEVEIFGQMVPIELDIDSVEA